MPSGAGPSLRPASTSATGLSSTRRAAKANASRDSASSHWRSSTRTRTGPAAALASSSESRAAATTSGPPGASALRPRACSIAPRCAGTRAPKSASLRRSKACRPAYGSSRSSWAPRHRSTVIPSPRAAASSSIADLPAPGSPRSSRAPPRPARAPTPTSRPAPAPPRGRPARARVCRGLPRRRQGVLTDSLVPWRTRSTRWGRGGFRWKRPTRPPDRTSKVSACASRRTDPCRSSTPSTGRAGGGWPVRVGWWSASGSVVGRWRPCSRSKATAVTGGLARPGSRRSGARLVP